MVSCYDAKLLLWSVVMILSCYYGPLFCCSVAIMVSFLCSVAIMVSFFDAQLLLWSVVMMLSCYYGQLL